MLLSALDNIFVFVLGTVFGSFFNVCIHRLPRGESVFWPPSRCPACRGPIRWRDNIPIVSAIALKWRCRRCGARISFRYAAVELLTGILFLWLWTRFGGTVQMLVPALLFSLLLIATVVDLEHQIIPDEVSVGGLVVGMLLSALVPSLHGETTWVQGLAHSGVGALVGGMLLYVTGVVGQMVFRKEAMGGGDVKLLAMLGAFLGWKKAVLIYLLAPVLAVAPGLVLKLVKRAEVIPFGPFLSAAGVIAFLWGDAILAWYWPVVGAY